MEQVISRSAKREQVKIRKYKGSKGDPLTSVFNG